jgi:3-isopropylmalate/(R)-2-methylmalate dehydratase small subunit
VATQTLYLPGGRTAQFPVDPFSKTCLLEGVDDLGYLLARDNAIEQYEKVSAV